MAVKNAEKDASHFPRQPWIWDPRFWGLKYSSVPGKNPMTLPGWYVDVVQKAGEKSGFFSGIMCSFSVNEVCKAVLFMSWWCRPQLYWCMCVIMVCLFCECANAYMQLFSGNGCNGFPGRIIEVTGRGDGQPALRQDTLRLLNIGSWTWRKNNSKDTLVNGDF